MHLCAADCAHWTCSPRLFRRPDCGASRLSQNQRNQTTEGGAGLHSHSQACLAKHSQSKSPSPVDRAEVAYGDGTKHGEVVQHMCKFRPLICNCGLLARTPCVQRIDITSPRPQHRAAIRYGSSSCASMAFFLDEIMLAKGFLAISTKHVHKGCTTYRLDPPR